MIVKSLKRYQRFAWKNSTFWQAPKDLSSSNVSPRKAYSEAPSPHLPRSLSWVGVGAMLSLLLPWRNLLHLLRVIDSKVHWKALHSPCHRMRGGGGVCNALQSAIFAPLTLVQHFLFTAAVWAILGVMKTNNCESDMDPSTLSGNRDKGRWLTWGILQEGFLLTVEWSCNENFTYFHSNLKTFCNQEELSSVRFLVTVELSMTCSYRGISSN